MPVCGTITVDFDGFIKYLDVEIIAKINDLTKQLCEINADLEMIASTNNSVARKIKLLFKSFLKLCICCLPVISNRLRSSGSVVDIVQLTTYVSKLEQIRTQIESKLKIFTSRRVFIQTPEFREKVLGQCPLCFDELINKSDTTIIPHCLHPVCYGCFNMIHNTHTNLYKCPMCNILNNMFYEILFNTIP